MVPGHVVVSRIIPPAPTFDTEKQLLMMQLGHKAADTMYRGPRTAAEDLHRPGRKAFSKGAWSNVRTGVGGASMLVFYGQLKKVI